MSHISVIDVTQNRREKFYYSPASSYSKSFVSPGVAAVILILIYTDIVNP